ncbi:MAG: hypothetical protein H6574_14130 [Lewinellaceae bacterium]|nr:hypothetical protein [Saprospiraceae bacterium]MCB9332218.1 hypothetical protein [Lewinellaceae bacterium]
MTDKAFFTRLAGITAGTAVLLILLLMVLPETRVHKPFAVASVLLFVLVSIGLFYAGRSTATSTSKVAFTNLVSASVFGKMVLAVAVLFIYQQSAQPANQWFVGIFLLVYVVYTIFEVWFMTKLAKT